MKKILIIVHHRKDRSPGQRFRIEHFIPYLEENNFEIIYSNILNEEDDKIFYSPKKYWKKFKIFVKSFFHRLKDINIAKKCDLIFIYREAFMTGTTFFERKFAKLGVPIVFDFDDSIWLNDTSIGNKDLSWLKNNYKTSIICSLSDLVSVGNEYLANYATMFAKNVFILPTTINTDYHKNSKLNTDKNPICIGWTGSETTINHFLLSIPVLKKIKEKYNHKVYFKVIANKEIWDKNIDVKFAQWSKDDEIQQLSEFDIGIMPLPNDKWSKGKCGFKGLQCMSLEIPVIMSPVGVNSQIINDGINGFLADSEQEWVDKISRLIDDVELRKKIGKEGRKTIEDKYSVEAWKNVFLEKINFLIQATNVTF